MNNMNDNRSYSGLVEKYIGTAYDTVAAVAAALREGWLTPDNMQTVDTREAFLDPEMRAEGVDRSVIMDLNKPYFTRGGLHVNDGDAAYYIYLDDQSRRLADGDKYIDPSVPMSVQGQGAGVGLWVKQVPGQQGLQGVPGPEGPEGAQGTTGATGGQGANGNDGVKGDVGDEGPTGRSGTPGVDGAVGQKGEQGIPGQSGVQGSDGEQGIQGTEGPVGPHGGQGDPGPTGNQGNPGIPGATGQDGNGVTVQGIDTITAILGKPNKQGDLWISSDGGRDSDNNVVIKGDGVVGDGSKWVVVGQMQGPQGNTGVAGVEGPTGPHGPDGADGPRGQDGPEGAHGPQGVQGVEGEQGVDGVPGHPGRGIHIEGAVATMDLLVNITDPREGEAHLVIDTGDLWIWDTDLTGRMGRETFGTYGADRLLDWHRIGHVQGPPGHNGATGARGPIGPQGSKGDRGLQGLKGATGAKGAAGVRGATGPVGPTDVSNNTGNLAKITSGKIFVRTQIFKGTGNPPTAGVENGDLFVKYSA